MRGSPPRSSQDHQDGSGRRTATELLNVNPVAPTPVQTNRIYGSRGHNQYTSANDGVFANLNAKPERGEKLEEHPPVSFLPSL
jgi:hypothetical protein